MKTKNKKVFSKNDFFYQNFGREGNYGKLGTIFIDEIIVRIYIFLDVPGLIITQ